MYFILIVNPCCLFQFVFLLTVTWRRHNLTERGLPNLFLMNTSVASYILPYITIPPFFVHIAPTFTFFLIYEIYLSTIHSFSSLLYNKFYYCEKEISIRSTFIFSTVNECYLYTHSYIGFFRFSDNNIIVMSQKNLTICHWIIIDLY